MSLSDVERDQSLCNAFAQRETDNLQFGLPWYRNLADHGLTSADQAVVYVARKSPQEFVACPMRICGKRRDGNALTSFYSSLFSPLASGGDPATLFEALFRHLAEEQRLAALTLAPMDPADPLFSAMSQALAAAGWRGVHDYFCFGNWTHDTGVGGFDEYLATRPSRVRNTLQRKSGKFLQDNKGSLSVVTGGELETAIAAFVDVYEHSWKRPEPFPEFMPGLIRLAADRGWLRLGLAHYNGVTVASQVWLVANNVACIYKLAYDRDFRHLSAGTLLTAHLMQHVLERDAVRRIDYLSGDDAYKQDWMSVRHERRGLAAYNPHTLRGWLLGTGHAIKRLAGR